MERKDVEHLAGLARIAIISEEADGLVADLGAVLGYVSQLQEVTGVDTNLTKGALYNVMREDVDPHESGLYTDDILANAPDREGDYIKVKKIL